MKLPNQIAIIGAGPSGLFMAERLRDLAEIQGKEIQITLFEKEDHVGGKCYTYQDQKEDTLRSEYGATAIAVNYGVVIDAMKKYGIDFEYLLPATDDSIELKVLFGETALRDKPRFISTLLSELKAFDAAYSEYKQCKEAKADIPGEFKRSFADFCRLNEWQYMEIFVRPYGPAFGYGDLNHCPTYSILEYLGHLTLSSILVNESILAKPGLQAVHGGFQTIMEAIGKTHDVRLGTCINKIQRNDGEVTIEFSGVEGSKHQEIFDALVLATSPKQWQSMGLDTTAVEKQCIEQLSYYRYPVAICRIKGLDNQQVFIPEAHVRSGFGHIALISSRDNRDNPENGRLCTIYINQKPGGNDYSFKESWDDILDDLRKIPNVTDATLIDEKYWDDYLPSLPWNLRLELEEQQYSEKTNTIYLGAYTLGAFEDVVCCANKAFNAANQLFGAKQYAPVEKFSFKDFRRASMFYDSACVPYNGVDEQKKEWRGCTIL